MVFSASSALRPRLVVMLRSQAEASFSTLLRITGSMVSPSRTGDEAPVLVPGAMAAMSADSRMKNPAEAARPPLGVTYAMTGTGEATILDVISRVASSRPPGVLRRIRTAAAFSRDGLIDGVRNDFDRDRVDDAVDVNGDDFRRGTQRKRSRERACEPAHNVSPRFQDSLKREQVNFDRILVRATNWVGDAVMSLPALRALRERFPRARISILAKPWVADLYGREPFCDQLIPYEARDLRAKWQVAREARTMQLQLRDLAAERVRSCGDRVGGADSGAHRICAGRAESAVDARDSGAASGRDPSA